MVYKNDKSIVFWQAVDMQSYTIHNHLITAFDHACSWNAFLYSIHKIFTTALTFILFNKLSTEAFSLYANINSIIFLLLLWTDCGFKKSIARFIPEYERIGVSFVKTLHTLLLFKIGIILCALPICAYAIYITLATLQLHHTPIIYSALIIFCSESILALLQLIYHAQFLHKYFNSIDTIGLLAYSSSAFLLCFYGSSSHNIVVGLIYGKIITSICTTLTAYLVLKKMPHNQQSALPINTTDPIQKSFIIHSAFMWFSTLIKSLTERNALVPLLTYTINPEAANVFKIANESALFFYRIALKTIGTNDTTILTIARLQKENIAAIFSHVQQKISYLCLFISFIFIPIWLNKWHHTQQIESTQLFFIITVCYLLEILLSPYERILEVDLQYRMLLRAYSPYILFLVIYILAIQISQPTIVATVLIIHVMRLMSAFLLVIQAKKLYYHAHLYT